MPICCPELQRGSAGPNSASRHEVLGRLIPELEQRLAQEVEGVIINCCIHRALVRVLVFVFIAAR